MDRHQYLPKVGLLQLPEEILLLIFGFFAKPASQLHELTRWRYPDDQRASDLPSLQNVRLTCRPFNELVSPLLCSVVKVNLDSSSLSRTDNLSRNPLIAKGIRGLEVNLRYRPSSFAADLSQYHAHVAKIVSDARGRCEYQTEFQSYEDEDESTDATKHRAYLEAEEIFWQYEKHWREHVEPAHQGMGMGVLETDSTVQVDQQLLQDCFSSYADLHEDQKRLVTNGSFVRTLVTVISRLKGTPFIWFKDKDQHSYSPDVLELAKDRSILRRRMEAPHDWLAIETLRGAGADLLPARILTDLPIACHEANVQLRGISVGCFPLTKGFEHLLPDSTTMDLGSNAWLRFATACQRFEIFHFGMTGMNCTPSRPVDFTISERLFIDSFVGAGSSGANLKRFCVNMTPFRKTSGQWKSSTPDQYYRAGNILSSLTSTRLLELQIIDVQISSNELVATIDRLSSSAQSVYLTGITLVHGRYASAMAALQQKTGSSHLHVELSSLQGAEFGPAKSFVDDGLMGMTLDEEERETYWDRLEEHMKPTLLKRTLEWIRNGQGEVNPLTETSKVLQSKFT